MSRLRSVLGRDRIEHRDHGYVLRCDWLDAAELAMLTDEVERRRGAGNVVGAAAAARVALSLLRGATPVPVPGEWAQLRQAGLERLASRGRLAAATALLEAGDWVAAADAAAAALERDPYEEAALRVLLRAYVMGGQAAAALAAYASARERLADELGTDPSPETTALYTAILRGEVAMPAPLPASAATGLVGRDDELAYLDVIAARARGGSVEVAVVNGEAGIGKTALLRTWAGRRAAAGDTVLMASCGQLDRAMPLDALLSRAHLTAAAPGARGHRRPDGRRCADARAPARRRARPPAAAGARGQRARPRGAVRGPGAGPGPARRAGPGDGGDRRRAPGRAGPDRTGCASCGAGGWR